MADPTDLLYLAHDTIEKLDQDDSLTQVVKAYLGEDRTEETGIYWLVDAAEKLSNFELFMKLDNLIENITEFKSEDIETLKASIKSELKSYLTNTPILNHLLLTNLFLALFLTENMTGPSFKPKEKYLKATKDKTKIVKHNFSCLHHSSPTLQTTLIDYFSCDGEYVYKNSDCLPILLFLECIFELTTEEGDTYGDNLVMKIFEARYYTLRDQIMSSTTFSLQDKALKLYTAVLEGTEISDKNILAMLWLEKSRVCYKQAMADNAIAQSKAQLGLKINLTGKLGRRTKYQKFDIPQLVLDVETESVNFVHPEVSPLDEIIAKDETITKNPEQEEEKITEDGELEVDKIAHTNVNLDAESILLEKVKLTEEESSNEISVYDQIYLNFFAYDQIKHYMDEYDLKYETVNAYISKVMEKSKNWLTFSMSLLLRSRNEKDKWKTKERCMIQMQTLIDQYRDETPGAGERVRFAFTCPYPLTWNLKRELGLLYQNYGSVLSAFELFKELDFYEDAAQCLAISGKVTQAEKYIDEIIEKHGETPQILCVLGDMKRKESYYERAWELSNHKYARAMRTLGGMYFERGQNEECITSLTKALNINKLYPSSWYALGCANIKLENYDKAIYAFGNVVSYDEQHGEAWSNIASCYMQLKKVKEAISCMEHAVKSNRNNWKIWENLIILYLQETQFHRVVSSIKQLIHIKRMERINVQLMLKVSNCFIGKFLSEGTGESQESIIRARVALFELFELILDHIPKDTGILRLYGRLISNILPNKYDKILDLKLREIKSLQTANWQYDPEAHKKVQSTIDELKQIMGDKFENHEEIRCFVKNTLETIEDHIVDKKE